MRVAFYCQYAFHRAMLERPYELGLDSSTLRSTWANAEKELVDARADVVVFSDDIVDSLRAKMSPNTIYVFTRHGFATKNYLRRILARCDFVCVSSEWVKADFCQRYPPPLPKIWITGFTATDQMWERLNDTGRSDQRRCVMYAPTWNPNLSAHPVLGTDWARQWLSNKQNHLMVKLHPHTTWAQSEWVDDWLQMAITYPSQLTLLESDSDIYSKMTEADLLISDTSSVMFYWLALDRPVILVEPDADENHDNVELEAPEWSWRDMGWNVNSTDCLLDAIQEAFERPHLHRKQREIYRERVFGDLFDGRASERLIHNLECLAQGDTISH